MGEASAELWIHFSLHNLRDMTRFTVVTFGPSSPERAAQMNHFNPVQVSQELNRKFPQEVELFRLQNAAELPFKRSELGSTADTVFRCNIMSLLLTLCMNVRLRTL